MAAKELLPSSLLKIKNVRRGAGYFRLTLKYLKRGLSYLGHLMNLCVFADSSTNKVFAQLDGGDYEVCKEARFASRSRVVRRLAERTCHCSTRSSARPFR